MKNAGLYKMLMFICENNQTFKCERHTSLANWSNWFSAGLPSSTLQALVYFQALLHIKCVYFSDVQGHWGSCPTPSDFLKWHLFLSLVFFSCSRSRASHFFLSKLKPVFSFKPGKQASCYQNLYFVNSIMLQQLKMGLYRHAIKNH